MKKLFACLCGLALSLSAFAQKGESAVGLSLGAAPVMESGVKATNFGLSARYQYGITDALRGEAILGYDFKDKGKSLFTVGVNAHYLFSVGEKLKVYPIVGIGFAKLKGVANPNVDFDEVEHDKAPDHYHGDECYDMVSSGSSGKFYYNVGAGVQYPLTDRLAANLEVKYQGIDHFNRLPISIGVTYKF
ncbi:MAG: porin family protein [Bacteroides sp.]|nr:porin family protein [Bacteroides sp.]